MLFERTDLCFSFQPWVGRWSKEFNFEWSCLPLIYGNGCIVLTHYLPCTTPVSTILLLCSKFLCKLPGDPSMKGAGRCCHCSLQDRFSHRLWWSRSHRRLRTNSAHNRPRKRTEGFVNIRKNGQKLIFCATSAGILEENLGCYDDLQVVSCIYIVCKRHVRNAICSDGFPSKERKVARFERWKKHLQHAFQIHFVHSGLTVINHSSTLDSQAAPHAVWRDTKSWCSAASLAQSDALANAQKNSSNIPRDPAETCQTREPRYCITICSPGSVGYISNFQWMYITSFHTWAEPQCRWPTKQCDLEILGLKSIKTQNLKPHKKYLNTKMLFWFPSLNHMSCPEHVLCRGAWSSFDQLLQSRNLFSTCSSTILRCSLQIIKIHLCIYDTSMNLWYI